MYFFLFSNHYDRIDSDGGADYSICSLPWHGRQNLITECRINEIAFYQPLNSLIRRDIFSIY